MTTALFVVIGWLAGSMPWGYWLTRVFKGVDIRSVGSGNIGATNVWRTFGRKLGVPVILLDIGKGFAPALAGTLVVGHGTGVLAGAAAMLGHYRPLFLGFRKGGKMVATAGGAFLGVAPIVGGLGAGLWLLVFLTLRYASVASMIAATSLPLWAWVMGYPWPVIAFGAAAAAAVVALHRANIGRLLHGQESRFRLRRRPKLSGSPTH